MSLSKVAENIKHTLLADPDTVAENHIVATSDIDNYFNLQITAQLYFGSEQEPHDLILDTGSMVSSPDWDNLAWDCLDILILVLINLFSLFLVDLGVDKGLLELWHTQ